jgi:hypothetical protein
LVPAAGVAAVSCVWGGGGAAYPSSQPEPGTPHGQITKHGDERYAREGELREEQKEGREGVTAEVSTTHWINTNHRISRDSSRKGNISHHNENNESLCTGGRSHLSLGSWSDSPQDLFFLC